MSASYRTERTKITAVHHFPRTKEGKAILPRVIERKPRIGDVHPLRKQHIVSFLCRMPVDYVYGLKRVELCPRTSDEIGNPFGCYLIDEKVICLYSVPPTAWKIKEVESQWLFEAYGAKVDIEQDSLLIHWGMPIDLAYMMYRDVFLHELGHHYDNQYRHKRKWPPGRSAEEASATRRASELAKRNVFFPLFRSAERNGKV